MSPQRAAAVGLPCRSCRSFPDRIAADPVGCSDAMEHRWGERFAVELAVRVAARPFSVRPGRLVNLSLSGAAVEIGFELRVLSRVQLALVMPHRFTHATPVISAYVARLTPRGIGLEWCEFAPRPVVELLRSAAFSRYERRLVAEPALFPSVSTHSL